ASPAQRTCEQAKGEAASIQAAELARHDQDQVRFDRVEGANFESRILRLMRYRMQRIEAGQLPPP
ncbi:MAG: DUF922 domain-containing protein, partial [Mesorhizobium sp.]